MFSRANAGNVEIPYAFQPKTERGTLPDHLLRGSGASWDRFDKGMATPPEPCSKLRPSAFLKTGLHPCVFKPQTTRRWEPAPSLAQPRPTRPLHPAQHPAPDSKDGSKKKTAQKFRSKRFGQNVSVKTFRSKRFGQNLLAPKPLTISINPKP